MTITGKYLSPSEYFIVATSLGRVMRRLTGMVRFLGPSKTSVGDGVLCPFGVFVFQAYSVDELTK